MKNRKIKHVAMYLRISLEKREEDVETLENHRGILTEFANENHYTHEIFGEVISAGNSDLGTRPELQRLLDNIEQFDAILCFDLTRLSRNGLISQTVKQYCMDYDKPIITPWTVYDLANSDTDRLMFDVGSMIAAHEHGIIGKRSKMNKKQMTKAGLHVSGNIPFGYRRNPATKKLEIAEEEAETVRRIFELHAQGFGAFTITDILNKEGRKPARSNVFNLPSIKRIIRNPVYKGYVVFNDRKRIKQAGKYKYEIVETISVKDAHPPIISPEEWDAANRERERRAEQAARVREKPAAKSGVTMLKDLVYCGVCGRKMIIRKDTKSKEIYTIKTCEYLLSDGERCPNNGIKLSFVEEDVLEKLTMHKEKLRKVLEELEAHDTSTVARENEKRLAHFNKQLREIDYKLGKLLELQLDPSTPFSKEKLNEQAYKLNESKQYLELAREELIREMESPSIEDMQRNLVAVIENIESLHKLATEGVNRALKTFVKKIYFKRVIPKEIARKSTRNPERKLYPFELEIEYF